MNETTWKRKKGKTNMTRKNVLGDNPLGKLGDPLFDNPIKPEEVTPETKDETSDFSQIVSNEKLEEVKKTISDMKHEVKKLEQRKKNREDEYQRMTFIIRKDLLDKLRDYCYTERLSQKEGLEQALVSFLEDKGDLVSHPERPKQVHKRRENE